MTGGPINTQRRSGDEVPANQDTKRYALPRQPGPARGYRATVAGGSARLSRDRRRYQQGYGDGRMGQSIRKSKITLALYNLMS
jgi:hypothetical protein